MPEGAMRRASIVIWAVVLGLLVSLVAVACGGGAEPTATPTTAAVVKTPTPTATLPPGVTPSPVPPTPTRVVVAPTPTPMAAMPKRGGVIIQNTAGARAASYDPFVYGASGLVISGPGIVYSGLVLKEGGPDLPPGGYAIKC